MGTAAAPAPRRRTLLPEGFVFDRAELSGAVADLGVFLPIAVALVVANGLSPTAVLLPGALLYIAVAYLYRLPVPVQPLKAFGAIAIASGLGVSEIASGALIMGVAFFLLGATGLLDAAARAFPRPLIRGVQLTVGLIFLRIAWELVSDPPVAFAAHALSFGPAILLSLGALALLLAFREKAIALVLVGVGVGLMLVLGASDLGFGPSQISVPEITGASLLTALTVLVIPQLPLTFANSCLATADVSKSYFGEVAARRVRPGRLAMSLGTANLFSGAIGGMPVCHGAGGMTAHRRFGARTGAAPLFMGIVLLATALILGAGLAAVLAAFPLPILAALLAAAGLLHIELLRDLEGAPAWALALGIGAVGFLVNLAVALGAGLVVYWSVVLVRRRMASRSRGV
jgi:hypothetical protein